MSTLITLGRNVRGHARALAVAFPAGLLLAVAVVALAVVALG
jgi:hypothetical protein